MNKLRGEALLPVYCQNTLVALILIISEGFYNFQTFKNWFLESIVFLNNAMLFVMSLLFIEYIYSY